MRQIEFEYRVLRNNAFYGLLQAPVEEQRSLRMDDGAEIKTSLSGTFSPVVLDVDGRELEPDWLSDELEPVLIIDGVEHPLGTYMPATVDPEEENGVELLKIEAYDRCWRVKDTYTESLLFFAAGTNYLSAIKRLLTTCGIILVVETRTDKTFAEAREDWDIGTSYLEIVNELLGEINYNPLWFDERGAAILEPASVPTAANIEHILSDQPDDLAHGALPIVRMLPKLSRSTDIYQAPNVFVCVCSNGDKSAPLVARAENNNPQSPLSIMRRGRRIVSVERVNNVENQAALQEIVNQKRNDSLIGAETISVSTALQPGFGVADVVGLRYGDLDAICIEHAWTMDLKVGGTMNHELERVVVNIG